MLYEIRGTVRIIEDSWSNPQMFVVINGDKKDFNGNNIFFEYVQNQMANGQPSLNHPLYSASILSPDVEFPVNNSLHHLMRIVATEQKRVKLIIDDFSDKVVRVELL